MSTFAKALEAEMVRVPTRGYHPAISRAEVERIGQATGLTPRRAVEECVRLRGGVWDGGSIESRDRGIMAFSPDMAWFHERGKLPDLG